MQKYLMIYKLIAGAVMMTALNIPSMNHEKAMNIEARKNIFMGLVVHQDLEGVEKFINERGQEARTYISLDAFHTARDQKKLFKSGADQEKLKRSRNIYAIIKKNTPYTVRQSCKPQRICLDERVPTPELLHHLEFTPQESALLRNFFAQLSKTIAFTKKG